MFRQHRGKRAAGQPTKDGDFSPPRHRIVSLLRCDMFKRTLALMPSPSSSWTRCVPLAALASAALLAAGCHSGLPKPQSAKYAQFVAAFYVGLGAFQVGNDARADDKLNQATQLAPGEPAAWADWGLLALRQRNYDAAKQRLDRAEGLAKDNGRIEYMLGLLESDRGNSAAAIADFRRADELESHNPRIHYSLATEIERQGAPDAEAQFEQILQQILAEEPNNLAALLELSRMAAKRGDAATLRSAVDKIAALSASWPQDAKQRLADLQSATSSVFLRNVLMQLPGFRQQLSVLRAEPGEEAPPFLSFLRLPAPQSEPAAADTAMTFSPEPLPNPGHGAWDWVAAVSLSDSGAPTVLVANAKTVQLSGGPSYPFPGGAKD